MIHNASLDSHTNSETVKHGQRFKDHTGKKFGRLTVLSFYGKKKLGTSIWLVRCDCGTIKTALGIEMVSGHTQSCGCLSSEIVRKRNTTHGFCTRGKRLPEYGIWSKMIQRCDNPNDKAYVDYGGRGIFISEPWYDFATFYRDMGPRPSPKHSINRLDNDGPYSKQNCSWGDIFDQMNNMRTNHFVEFMGERKTIAQWARPKGWDMRVIWLRLKRGWSIQDALTRPLRKW